MVIAVDPALEVALKERAQRQGVAPEVLALEALRKQFLPPAPSDLSHDEWVRRLRSLAIDCGVSLSDEAVSSEGIYE